MLRRIGIRSRFLIVTLAVYLVTGAVAVVALASVIERLTERLGEGYAGKYALAASALLREPLDREIALARLMADSPVVREWLRAEGDDAKRAKAFAELESYRRRFAERSWFLVADSSLNYYFDDQTNRYGDTKRAYTLARDNPKDEWYFATLKNVPEFALNVNYDRVLDTHKVWINVVMRGQDGAPLGLTGTGLDLSGFLHVTVDNTETGVENVILDHRLAIQAHRDRAFIDQHSVAKRSEELSTVTRLINTAEDVKGMQTAFEKLRAGSGSETFFLSIDGRRCIAGAAYVSSLEWYVLSILDLDRVIGRRLFMPILILGAAITLVLAVVVSFAVNRIILKPLAAITSSAQRIAEGDYSPLVLADRPDEIGTLIRTFSQMNERIRNYTENLEQLVQDRTTQLHETNCRLQENMEQLQGALANVRTLEGILPICAYCKKIRDDKGYWTQVEAYISKHTSAHFSHGLCPECIKKNFPQYADDEQLAGGASPDREND